MFQKKPWALFCLALLFLLPLLFLSDIPQRDVLSRYAPMAQAIATGNWVEAFHPRIAFLFPSFGAICIRIFSCDAFTGVKIASAICFLLTIFPLWKIFSTVFDQTIAKIGCVLLIFCPYWLRIASSGLRDSSKLLFLIWTVWGLLQLYRNRKSIKGYLIVGFGCGAMTAIRDDSLLIGVLFGLACLWLERKGTKRFPWRSFIAGLVAALILLPGLILNYQMTGYPVPGTHFIGMASSVMKPYAFGTFASPLPHFQPGKSNFPKGSLWTETAPITQPASEKPAFQPVPENLDFQPVTWTILIEFLVAVSKGYYFLFAIPAIIMIFRRIRSQVWTPLETLLLAVWLGHGLIIIFEILVFDRYLYVSRRYLLPAAPLAFGWTALALRQLYEYCLSRFSIKRVRKIATGTVLLLCCLFYLEALSPELKNRFLPKYAEKRNAMLAWSAQIKTLYQGPSHQTSPQFQSGSYYTFRRPLVACLALPETVYLTGGEGCSLTPEDALTIGLRADFLVARIKDQAPHYPGYRLLNIRRGSKHSYALYACRRE